MFIKLDTTLEECNLKFAELDGEFKFSGYASVFNSNDGIGDTIKPGAFKSANGKKLPLFINHGHYEIPVGSFKGKEDETGFFINGDVNPHHTNGPSAYSSLKRKELTGLSIGFKLKREDWIPKEDDRGRVIKKVELLETSLVGFPMEGKARVSGVKSSILDEVFDSLETKRDLERWLRDEFGYSKSMAVKFISHAERIVRGDPGAMSQQNEGAIMLLRDAIKSLNGSVK